MCLCVSGGGGGMSANPPVPQINMSKTKHGTQASSCSYCLPASDPGAPRSTLPLGSMAFEAVARASFPTCPTLRFPSSSTVTAAVSASLSQFGFCCCDNCHDQMQLWKGVYFAYTCHLTVRSTIGESQGRNPSQELKQTAWANAAYWLSFLSFLL